MKTNQQLALSNHLKNNPVYRDGRAHAERGNRTQRALHEMSLRFSDAAGARKSRLWLRGFDDVIASKAASEAAPAV